MTRERQSDTAGRNGAANRDSREPGSGDPTAKGEPPSPADAEAGEKSSAEDAIDLDSARDRAS
jgi:hypothetical protein